MPAVLRPSCQRFATFVAALLMLAACGGNISSDVAGTGANSAQRGNKPTDSQLEGSQTVRGRIFGLQGTIATVTLGNQAQVLGIIQTDAQGRFEFTGVPYGNYFVKAEAAGVAVSPAQVVTVNPPTVLSTYGLLSKILPAPSGLVFTAARSSSDQFSFHWDSISGGQEAVAHINAPPVIQFRSEAVTMQDTAATNVLFSSYNVVLSDEGVKWTQEAASRLLATLGTLSTRYVSYGGSNKPFRLSKWVLTDQFLANDITITRDTSGDTVLLSSAALVYATPRLVYLDGVPGRYFSKRLHHALTRFVTQDGSDTAAVEYILNQRFGVSLQVYDYTTLTANTTRESNGRFTAFRPAELVELISSLEEMPEGFYKVTGLKYLVRRAYGTEHPIDRRIMSMAETGAGYIEFSDAAFTPKPTMALSPQRLILHEKTHFLWANVFSTQLKNDWTTLGKWFRNPANSTQWLTSSATAFVSEYPHPIGPDEDMAESVADYIVNPDRLRSRSPDKFAFIQSRIFQGDRYVPVIREDLTFTVVDLAPDYLAPGKVKSIDLTVKGAPTASKVLEVTIELFGESSPTAGAKSCIMSLDSPSGKRTASFYLWPLNANGNVVSGVNSTRLRGSYGFSAYEENGYWAVTSLQCNDVTGNVRYSRNGDMGGAALYLNSPLQSTNGPEYEPGSFSLIELAPVMVQGHRFKRLQSSWRAKPSPLGLNGFMAALNEKQYGRSVVVGSCTFFNATRTVTCTYDIPDYFPNGTYVIAQLLMRDDANVTNITNFSSASSTEPVPSIDLINDHPDPGRAPELDLNRITLTATPTKPSAPDGETKVKIVFYARDDGSGLDQIQFRLLNPQGDWSAFGFTTTAVVGGIAENAKQLPIFPGDATAWQRYEVTITLPVGSIPGKWGVSEIYIRDKALNYAQHPFVELMHFVVDK
jgi:hypothetical protein